ncbi:hypothetical protein ABPG72_017181 [Tetrahymena utriculariae]
MFRTTQEGLFGGQRSYSKYQDLPPLNVQPLLQVIKNQQQDHNKTSQNLFSQTQVNKQQSNLFGQLQNQFLLSNIQFSQPSAFNNISPITQQQQNYYPQQQQSQPPPPYNQVYKPFGNLSNTNYSQINHQQINSFQAPFGLAPQIPNISSALYNNTIFQQQPSFQILNQQVLNQYNSEVEKDDIGQCVNHQDDDDEIDSGLQMLI